MKRLALLLFAGWLAGCDCGGFDPPVADSLGTYDFHAQPFSAVCSIPNLSTAAVDFRGTLAWLPDGGVAFTSAGRTNPASYDGQVVVTVDTQPLSITLADGGSCATCDVRVTQTISAALLSKSQSVALKDACPPHPLDGGVPGADAGVSLPVRKADGGFDSVRVCGELRFVVTATGFCDPICNGCSLLYTVSGPRS